MSTVLAKFPSSSSQKEYEIIKGDDGVIYCTCWAWKKNRICKHLVHYKKIAEKPTTEAITNFKNKTTVQNLVEEIIKELNEPPF